MQLNELADRARKAFLLRDMETAEKLVLQMHTAAPDHPGILLFMGNIYTAMGRFNQAIQAYQESIELDPANPEAHNNIGIVYRREGNFPAAVGALEQARKIAPDRADIWYNLANVYKQMDDPEEAEVYYRKSLELNPGLTRAYNNLGNLYETRGMHDKAHEFYSSGLKKDPNNPTLSYNLGITYQSLGRVSDAIRSYRQALRSRPNWIDGLNNLGILLEETGEYDEARLVLENALKMDTKNPRINNNLGVILSAQGNHELAMQYLQKAVDADPSYTTAGINLGTELEELNDLDAAWKQLQNIKTEEPSNMDVREKIARLAVKTGRQRQAREEIRFILDHNPQAGFPHALLGDLALTEGNRKKAEQSYRRAITLDPEDIDTTLNLALLYKELKEYNQAIARVSDILAKNPRHSGARLLLGKLYLYENLYTEAISILNALYEDFPYDEQLMETLIRAHRGAGNKEEALRFTEELINLQGQRQTTLDLDKLEQSLSLYEETVEAYAEEHERRWEENLKQLINTSETEAEPEEVKEEESLFFDTIPDLDQPAEIIDVGGIEPVIVINEDEERLRLKEMEEEILSPPPEEEKEEEDEPPVLAASAPLPSSGLNGAQGGQLPGTINVNVQTPPQPGRIELGGSLSLLPTPGITTRIRRILSRKTRPEPEEQVIPEEKNETPAELLRYLEDLTEYLPEEKRRDFEHSEMKLRMEVLLDRLEGRPSLRQQAAVFESREESGQIVNLNPESISSTLSFMGDLSTYLPDPDIGVALHHKIADILRTMKRDSHGIT